MALVLTKQPTPAISPFAVSAKAPADVCNPGTTSKSLANPIIQLLISEEVS